MISKTAKFLFFAGLAGLTLAPLPASAGWVGWGMSSHPLVQAGLNACGGDIAHFCTSIAPGGGRIAQCLTDHRDALSPPCHTFVQQTEDARFAYFACSSDASRLCADVLPGGGRVVACLRSRSADISPACKEGLTRASAALDH
jgi:hypothetical protein